MPVTNVLAALAVSYLTAALAWHERLHGRPADALPMDGLAEWHVPGGGTMQLVEDGERAGRGLLTLAVDDLAAEVEALRRRGIDPHGVDETTSDKVLFVTIEDPDGNALTLVEQRPGG